MTTGALTLSITDVAFFTPPNRSEPDGRPAGDAGIVAAFRSFRRALAVATEAAGESLPRVTRSYPY